MAFADACSGKMYRSVRRRRMGRKAYLSSSIFTAEGSEPISGAVVMNNDIIEYVGPKEDIPFDNETIEIEDLGDKTIIPGLIDIHTHSYPGIMMEQVTSCFLSPEYTHDELVQEMTKFIEDNPEPINGIYNFFDYNFDNSGRLNVSDLDALFGDVPIMLVDHSLHGGTFSTAALKMLGYDPEAPLPEGSEVVYEEDGSVGYFIETIFFILHVRALTLGGDDDADKAIDEVQRRFNAAGFTTIGEMRPLGSTPDYIWPQSRYLEREAEGSLTLRIGLCTSLAIDKSFWEKDIATFHGDYLFFNALKGFMDGGYINSTAWTTAEYIYGANKGKHPGCVNDIDFYSRKIKEANDMGIGVRVHAEGDLAIEKAIEMYRLSDNKTAINHIEHATCMTDRTLQMIKDYVDSGRRLAINFQPIFLYQEAPTDEQPVGCGNEFYNANAVRVKDAMETGAIVTVGSTDFPVEQPDAARHIRVAVNRLSDEEGPFFGKGYTIHQAITLPEALKGNTINAATALGREEDLGLIKTGYKADITVFGQDIFALKPEDYKEIKVYKTICNGKEVYVNEQ